MTDVTCHPYRDMGWTCLGCEAVLCRYCDGIPGEEILCWTCNNAEDGDAA